MMAFFRKYQRLFFILITIVIVVTFSFFGTLSTNVQPTVNKKDKVIGKAIDGSVIHQKDIQALSYFLNTSPVNEQEISEFQSSLPNLLNDGVILRDFIQTGIADVLVSNYFSILEKDLQQRFKKIKSYVFYSHPKAPFISARAVWKQLQPQMISNFDALRTYPKITNENFYQYIKLFQQQRSISPEMIKKILLYQQSQYPWIGNDIRLMEENFSLLGAHSIEDWFGRDFVDLVSQFIWNISILAEKKGFSISSDSALYSLLSNIEKGLEKNKNLHSANRKGINKELFRHQVRMMGLDEKTVIKVWQRVLLFRQYFQEIKNSIIIDDLPFGEIDSFMNEQVKLRLYQLPKHLCLNDFSEFLQLLYYVKAVSPSLNDSSFKLTDEYYPYNEIEKNYPEFIEQEITLAIAQIDNDDIAMNIGEKMLWDWQIKDDNWKKLCNKFSELKKGLSEDIQQRFNVLEELPKSIRYQIDLDSRKMIIKEHPEWMKEELSKMKGRELTVSLPSKGGAPFLRAISDQEALHELLMTYPDNEENITDKQLKAKDQLLCYSQDQKTYYRIEVIKKDGNKKIIPFSAVFEDGILRKKLAKELEQCYPVIRIKNSKQFRDENNDWKPFREVKDLVGKHYFSSILSNMNKEDKKIFLEQNFLYFLTQHIGKTRENIINSDDQSKWVIEKGKNVTLIDQWKLESEDMTIFRNHDDEIIKNIAFCDDNNTQWTQIEKMTDGKNVFIQRLEKEISMQEKIDDIYSKKRLLANEVVSNLSRTFLLQMQEKQAITLPLIQIVQE